MKVGDLVVSIVNDDNHYAEGIGIVVEPPRLSEDCLLLAPETDETYYIVKVLWPAGIEEVFEDDCEVINESR
mgnify:FL=1